MCLVFVDSKLLPSYHALPLVSVHFGSFWIMIFLDQFGSLVFGQASSERKIQPSDREGISELALECLQDAATFASICTIRRQSDDIIKDLKQWWVSNGKDLLLVDNVEDVDEEDALALI